MAEKVHKAHQQFGFCETVSLSCLHMVIYLTFWSIFFGVSPLYFPPAYSTLPLFFTKVNSFPGLHSLSTTSLSLQRLMFYFFPSCFVSLKLRVRISTCVAFMFICFPSLLLLVQLLSPAPCIPRALRPLLFVISSATMLQGPGCF